ncbi:MSP7-like protein (MSRP4) [Plasmodium malariae]|uniref:MSP7-like protein (MSRP4) n=1 Tax=Plasmodium malariae TaxID=5858 RepID=A0A1A8W8G8_PLAMA|nr:MSP7-like protein (MSRP4) [Plasmodium malariae]
MVKKLIEPFSERGKTEGTQANAINEVFKKALTDDLYYKEFTNVIHGIYIYVKQHSYLNENSSEELYNKAHENAINILDTIMDN